MANQLGNFDAPNFIGQSLMYLGKNLGLVNRVYRPNGGEIAEGSTLEFSRPSYLKAQDLDDETPLNIEGQNVSMSINKHKVVPLSMRVQDLQAGGSKLVSSHIPAAMDAIIGQIEEDIFSQAAKVGPKYIIPGPSVDLDAILGPRAVLRANGLRSNDIVNYAIDSGMEKELSKQDLMTDIQYGDNSVTQSGVLPPRYNVSIFPTMNEVTLGTAMTSTATASGGTGPVGAVVGDTSVNVGLVTINGLTDGQTFEPGDTFQFSNNDPVTYILTSGATVAGGQITVQIYPELRKSVADGTGVLFNLLSPVEEAAYYKNIMFHSNAFAFSMGGIGALREVNAGVPAGGAMIEDQSDPETGLNIILAADTSARLISDINFIAIYGVQLLEPRLACRVLRPRTVASF